MKRILFSIAFLLISVLNISAQKELIFENINAANIKVKSPQGIEVNFIAGPFVPDGSSFNSSKAPLYIGYFHEKSTSANWTFISTVGLYAEFGTRPVSKLNDSTHVIYFDNTNKNTRGLSLGAGIESRWYLGKNERYKTGKAQLKTGLFLSFPVSLKTTLLQTPEPLYNQGLFPSHFNVNVSFTPTIGYRQAISDRFFLEGSLGLGAYLGIGNGKNFYNYPVSTFSMPTLNAKLKIKAAYTF
ncbi:MAG TPA: hypothetical protein VIK55_11550 [Paludibacter sp.]